MGRIASWQNGPIAACFVLASQSFACGEAPAQSDTMTPLEVAAFPPGSSFEGSQQVELKASRPAEIYYAFDGRDPVGPDSVHYSEPLQIEQTTLVTFVAIAPDGRWSEPKSELYAPRTTLRAPEPLDRALESDRDIYFFTAEPGHPEEVEATFELRSIGLEAVRVGDIYIGAHAASASSYEPGVFKLAEAFEPFDLEPEARREVRVRYRPTLTIRGAALYIVSNDEKHTGGVIQIELWGRVINW